MIDNLWIAICITNVVFGVLIIKLFEKNQNLSLKVETLFEILTIHKNMINSIEARQKIRICK
jgi:hypothetical protein